MRLLLIDNFDSFTYNVQQLLRSQGAQVEVIRNNALNLSEIEKLNFDAIVLSPGPGGPDESGICPQVVARFGRSTPILGVCLGLQIIAQTFGATVTRAPLPMHGKCSRLTHDGAGLFFGLPQNFEVMRYHSLCVDRAALSPVLEGCADSDDGVLMGLRHCRYPIHAVQFHPESFLSQQGDQLAANFIKIVEKYRAANTDTGLQNSN